MIRRNFAFPGPRMPPQASAKNPRERTRGEQLLAEIETFMRRNPHYSQGRFGREAVNNGELVRRLHEGLDPEEITQRRVRKFIADNGG
jgi:hypothetical protein